MPIATVAQLKALLPGYSGTADDAALAVELARAEAELAAVAGWPANDAGVHGFVSSTYTVFPSRRGALPRSLLLGLRGVTAVASAYVTYDETYDASTLVDAGSYVIDRASELLMLRSSGLVWSPEPRGNRVACTAGWAEGAAPGDLEAAVLAQAKYRWLTLRVGQDVGQVTIAGASWGRAQPPPTTPPGLSPVAFSALQASVAYMWERAVA